ncbi:MAG TPA: serine/threonine-protein kinase, partial [Candidatus Limnocylindrales bacterium]|nr:serine/threonine-protein kinase [Candidatus Limnocylindrales bacterium]
QLVRLIGSGSGGQVWLAKNALGTYRAVKIIFKKTFQRQKPFDDEFHGVLKFEPLSRLHDGLVDVLQVGGSAAAEYFYCVMELGDDIRTGQTINPEQYKPRTLAHDLNERRRLPIGECVRLGAAIASALGFLHRNGLIHRDVKPANLIFVNGFPKLVDIGLVTEMFQPSSHVGTEGFIPPEGPGTARADIYSLGKVLYEISTGKDRNDYPELPADLGNTAEARDLVQFNKIVLKACRANPRLRYRDAEEMMSALLAFQFCRHDPRQEKILQTSAKVIGVGGILVAIGVITFLIWRILWLLRHQS